MIEKLKSIKGGIASYTKRKKREKALQYVRNYVKENKLEGLLAKAHESSGSTGVDEFDYALLHKLVRTKKPKYVLECGTGLSTWILAHALHQNFVESGIKGKVISMESIKVWYDQAAAVFPKEYQEYAEIKYSEPTTFMYSFIKGTCYSEIPDLPYEVVFVDGPAPEVREDDVYETVNMDFVKVMLKSKNPVTAVVDYRLRTNIAYGVIFGKDKVKFIKPWNVGIIENVTKEDMILNGDATRQKKILSMVAQFEEANPSWIDI
jgi:hypothetical protein